MHRKAAITIPRSDFGHRIDAGPCLRIFSIWTGLCDDCPNAACRRARSCAWQHPTCYDRDRAEGGEAFAGAFEFAGEAGMLAPLPDDPDGSRHLARLDLMRTGIEAERRRQRRRGHAEAG